MRFFIRDIEIVRPKKHTRQQKSIEHLVKTIDRRTFQTPQTLNLSNHLIAHALMILNLLLVEREVGGRKKGGISVPCSVFRVPCSAFRVPRFGVERFSGTAQLVALPLLI